MSDVSSSSDDSVVDDKDDKYRCIDLFE